MKRLAITLAALAALWLAAITLAHWAMTREGEE